MLLLDNYQELLRKLEKLKRRTAEANGELKGVVASLNKEGFATLKDAATGLPKLEDDARRTAERYTTAKLKLEEDFKDQLEGL